MNFKWPVKTSFNFVIKSGTVVLNWISWNQYLPWAFVEKIRQLFYSCQYIIIEAFRDKITASGDVQLKSKTFTR